MKQGRADSREIFGYPARIREEREEVQVINEIRQRVREKQPLIHCITNPISIRDCANAILAVGARPMMAEHPLEAEKVTRSAGAVLLNLGSLTDARMASMRISAAAAKASGIPFVLDLCGAACLDNRRHYAASLMERAMPSVVKGNYSEIKAMYDAAYHSSGVDAQTDLEATEMDTICAALAERWHTVVLASGKADIITDGETMLHCNNGTPQLACVTGTGCMQGALCAAFLSAADGLSAAAAACGMLGVCGEVAQTPKGSGSFGVGLMDALSAISDEELEQRLRLV